MGRREARIRGPYDDTSRVLTAKGNDTMTTYQLVVPAHRYDGVALSRAGDGLKKARRAIAKATGVSRRDLAVVGPRVMYRAGRMVGLVYRLYHDPLDGEVCVVSPDTVPEAFDPWAGEAKEI